MADDDYSNIDLGHAFVDFEDLSPRVTTVCVADWSTNASLERRSDAKWAAAADKECIVMF